MLRGFVIHTFASAFSYFRTRVGISTRTHTSDPPARAITSTLLALPEFQRSKNVSCFLSMPSAEVDTSAVVAAILSTGACPYAMLK